MTGKILTSIGAVVAGVLGYGALIVVGTELTRAVVVLAERPVYEEVVLLVLGALLLSAAALSVARTSIGAIVLGVGSVSVAFGATILGPAILSAVLPLNAAAFSAVVTLVSGSVAATVGAVHLGAGIAAAVRRAASGPVRAVAGTVGGVVIVAAVVLLLGPAANTATLGFRSSLSTMLGSEGSPAGLGIGGFLVLAGVVLLVVGLLSAVLSAIGVIAAGALLTLVGLMGVVAPVAVLSAPRVLVPLPLAVSTTAGTLLVVGLVLVGGGVGTAIRRRVAREPALDTGGQASAGSGGPAPEAAGGDFS